MSRFADQLLALGSLALDLHEQGEKLTLERLSTPQIDCCSGLHGGGLVEPLASLLHDSLSIILATNSEKHSLSSRVARKSLLERCQEIRSRLECLSPARGIGEAIEEEPMPEVMRMLESLGGLLAGLVDDKSNGLEVCWPFPLILTAASFHGWDSDSIHWWETGNRVCLQIQGEELTDNRSAWDWSAAVVSWAKAVENELNLSAAHWVRRDLGVDLPLFFNRHQPNVEAIFNPTANYSLDFNSLLYEAGSSGQWRPPSLGPLLGVLNHYTAREALDFLHKDTFQTFNACLDVLRRVHNSACHPRWVAKEAASELLDSVTQMRYVGILGQLTRLKQGLQKKAKSKERSSIWIARYGKRFGPYSSAHAQRYLEDGLLSSTDYAWTAGMDDWGMLSEVLKD